MTTTRPARTLAVALLLLVVLAAAVVVVVVLRGRGADPLRDPEAIAATNRGVALMGQFDYDAARDVFADVVARYPDWIDARVNLAIATLNRNRPEDNDVERAIAILDEVLAEAPEHLEARYCAGILQQHVGDIAASLEHFVAVAEADPDDAYAAYYVGQALAQEQRYREAIPWYERAKEIDPYLRSAYYGLSQALMREGEPDRARALQAEFDRLDGNPRAHVAQTVYTKMGPKAMAMTIDGPPAPPPPPDGAVFEEAVRLPGAGDSGWSRDGAGAASITAADIDGDGDLDLFLPGALDGAGGAVNAVLRNDGGRFAVDREHPLAAVTDVRCALWGDLDNDHRTDVYLCRRGFNALWMNSGEDGWIDVTDEAGAGGGARDTVDGALLDLDHDGDLDVYLVQADGPNELLNNDRDGTFRPIASAQGIDGGDRPSRRVVAVDLDRDRDLDLVVIHAEPPHEVFLNDRLWSYRPAEGVEALTGRAIDTAVAADLDDDGTMELVVLGPDGAVQRFGLDAAGAWRLDEVAPAVALAAPRRLAVLDVTGDGRDDVLRGGGDGWSVIDGATTRFNADASLRAWTPVLLDPARGPSVVGRAAGAAPVAWGPGPGRHGFVAFDLGGAEDTGDQWRSNFSGLGAHLAVRVGRRWSLTTTLPNAGGPGQNLQPVAVGLGGAPRVDFIAIDWSDGVYQTELDLAAGAAHRIVEDNRQMSSCPVIFAWDGRAWSFISDVLGVGGVGFALAPGEYVTPRPWERFLLPEGAFGAAARAPRLRIAEPMEEACYLDGARLVAWDLPPGWSILVDERMATGGPAPTGETLFVRREQLPVAARNDRGEDVLDAVLDADGRAAPVGPLDRRFLGRLVAEHGLDLEFDAPLDAAPGRPVLVADGWVEYPYSQTMFAAWQADAAYEAPTLEARGADGAWIVVAEQFGYPAGMPRRMAFPLDLPPGTTALRLRSNQEIYWDRLAVAFVEPAPADARRVVLPPIAATLARVGFPPRDDGPQRRPGYDTSRWDPLWDTRHQRGRYTRFGDVLELVVEADHAVAIFGPGEAVDVDFAPPPPPPPSGWTRRFVLETEGWCKDMDLFTRDGETVAPIPGEETGARVRLHPLYTTRVEGGR